jgi:hypothetical protein
MTYSLSWCQAPILDPWSIFSILSLIIFLDSFRFVDVGRPLWREVGSVVFSFFRASPAQPFSDLSPTGLMSIVYCLYFWYPQPGGPGSCIYFAQEQGSPVIPPCIGLSLSLLILSTYNLLTQVTRKNNSLFCYKCDLLPSNGCICHNTL